MPISPNLLQTAKFLTLDTKPGPPHSIEFGHYLEHRESRARPHFSAVFETSRCIDSVASLAEGRGSDQVD